MINQMPAAPVDMVLPATADAVYNILAYAVLALVAVAIAVEGGRRKSAVGLLCLLGGVLSTMTEPIWDVVACVWWATGQHAPLLRAFNYSIPYWALPAYVLYMGAQGYWILRMFEAGLSAGRLWKLFFIFWVTNALIEVPGLNLGLYVYYGEQPFKFFGFPLWMAMTNSVAPIAIGAALYSLRNLLTGARALLVVPLVPMVVGACETSLGWPVWLALNSGLGPVATHAAALATLGLSVGTVYMLTVTACRSPLAGAQRRANRRDGPSPQAAGIRS